MYEMEMASDYPGYDGPSVSNGFLEPVDEFDSDEGEDFAWFELDHDFDDWLEPELDGWFE